MTAKEAFLKIINDKDYLAEQTPSERKAIHSYKSKYYNGTLKFKHIDTLLEKHGFKMVKEAQWRKTKKVEPWLVEQMLKK